MVSLQLATVCLAISAGGDTVLLNFTSATCGPCRTMAPVVAGLVQAGFPVRKVDVEAQRELAARFGVRGVPCFVMVVDGQESGRITGATTRESLLGLLAAAGGAAGRRGRERGAADPFAVAGEPRRESHATQEDARAVAVRGPGSAAADTTLLASSVRLTIEDPSGTSYGTGTIVDARSGEALVVTCGHVFRDSQGRGKISIDLCGEGAPQDLPARLISYSLQRDVGLVSFRPGGPVAVARVAGREFAVRKGDAVRTVGCNHGDGATVERGAVLAINRFVGEPNLQVSGQPVQGRSGGGLFSSEGLLIGVCNAADPADDAGLYAALGAVHDALDEAQLSFVYDAAPAPSAESAAAPVELAAAAEPRPPLRALTAQERATLSELQRRGAGAEIICIVRPLPGSNRQSEIFVLDQASPEFQQLVTSAGRQADRPQLTSLEIPRAAGAPGEAPRGPAAAAPPRRPLMR
jgi:thiol-disulfide isomerase/thioredoxin